MSELLKIDGLSTFFFTEYGTVKAVEDVNWTIRSGEIWGLIGESGSGKSTLALSIMRMVPPPGKIVKGNIYLADIGDLMTFSENEMRQVRGKMISMSFQDPGTYLNPVVSVGNQIAEAIRIHNSNLAGPEVWARVIDLMNRVGIPSPEKIAKEYPHQMSGGMKQRILIAIALSCSARLYIADEPTTSLDVIVQERILDLLHELGRKSNNAIIFISHDISLVARSCDKAAMMYAGQMMEEGDVKSVFEDPCHPYTKLLMKTIPAIGAKQKRLLTISGRLPDLADKPSGCAFNSRCPDATPACKLERPAPRRVGADHYVSCLQWET